MFRTHDHLNIPTFIHLSMHENQNIKEKINFPCSFSIGDPSLERISVKKMKSIEKGYDYPMMDIVFVRGEVTMSRNGFLDENDKDCGFYEGVQTISRPAMSHIASEEEPAVNPNGYLIFAYKTMEDMHTQKFTESWKTWSGARMLCTRMPLPHIVTKLSFYRRVSGSLNFEYVLIAKVKNMLMNAAPALNVLHYMKPRVCAYFGAYRKTSFEVSKKLCERLGLLDADFVDAITNRMRITYSNNTGYIELSKHIEFQCKEEKEESTQTSLTPGKISTQVQTDPTLSSMRQNRTLPRTISSTPVPGTLSVLSSPSEGSYFPRTPTRDSVLTSILENRTRIVTIGNNFLLVLDNRDAERSRSSPNRNDTNDESEKITLVNENINNQNNQQSSFSDDLTSKNNMGGREGQRLSDDGALLRRLKTEYFQSEEYTAAELCRATPI